MSWKFGQKIIDFLRCKKLVYKIKAELFKQNIKNIIVIGDSHVNFFSGNENISFERLKFISEYTINNCSDKLPFFTTFHLGPCLAFKANSENSTTQSYKKVKYLLDNNYITQNSIAICSFGEIDIRAHIIKQSEKNNVSVEFVINNVINNYVDFLKKLKKRVKQVIVWGPIATGFANNTEIPTYGSMQYRNKVTLDFTRCLETECKKIGIEVFSICSSLIDNDYYTKKEFISSDDCHLSQSAWLYAEKCLSKIIPKIGVALDSRED